ARGAVGWAVHSKSSLPGSCGAERRRATLPANGLLTLPQTKNCLLKLRKNLRASCCRVAHCVVQMDPGLSSSFKMRSHHASSMGVCPLRAANLTVGCTIFGSAAVRLSNVALSGQPVLVGSCRGPRSLMVRHPALPPGNTSLSTDQLA